MAPALPSPPGAAPGDGVAALPQGPTRYRLEGPPGGRPVLLVHGATVPHWQFEALVPELGAAGLRTLRFDLYGHGESAGPPGPYVLARFVEQAAALLDHLGFPGETAVLGHSMGAAVAAELAVARLAGPVVLSAPLLDFRAVSRVPALVGLPLAGALLMRAIVLPALRRRRRRRFREAGWPELAPRFDAQADRPGFGRALRSLMGSDALGPHHARYAALGESGRDVLLIRGAEDAVVDPAQVARIRALLPGHAFAELAGLEHNLLLTAPETVAGLVCAFLETCPPPGP